MNMSMKRSATSELNHENWDREDDEPEEAGNFTPGDEETLKKRVIKKAKRRGAVTSSTAGSSVFSAFGGFSSTAQPPSTTTTSGAFDFLSGGFGRTENKKPASTAGFSFGSSTDSPIFGSSESEPSSKGAFLFGSKSDSPFGKAAETSTVASSVFGGSAETANSLEDARGVNKKESSVASPLNSLEAFKPKGNKWTCKSCMVSNDEEKEVCPCCQSPKPGAEAAAAVKKIDTNGVQTGKKWTCDTCMVPNDPENDACVCCDGRRPGSAPKKTSQPASGFSIASGGGFKFGATATDSSAIAKTDGAAFKFGSTNPNPAAGGFKFGATSSAKSASPAKPASGFPFGTSSSVPSSTEDFKFGGSSKLEQTEKKASKADDDGGGRTAGYLAHLSALNKQFSRWISQNLEKDSYVLLTPCFKDYEKHLATIDAKFDGEPDETKQAAGTETNPASSDKPLLGAAFSLNPTTSKTPSGTSEDKVASAESSSSKDKACGFTFGSQKPFSFGSGTSSTDKVSEPTSKGGFSFGSGSGSAQTLSPFGSGSMFGAAAASAMAAKKSEPPEEEEETDEPPKVEVTQVVEEDSIHTVRCKLFYKKGKEFVEKGLGMLYLKNVDGDTKSQLLVRAETNLGNILLNILLNKQMNLTRRSNNVQFVCVPNPSIPGVEAGPLTMLVRVKNGDVASILEDKIKELLSR